MYVYSDNADYCKALVVRINTAADAQFRNSVNDSLLKLSHIYRVKQFSFFLDTAKKVYNERMRRI